MLQAQRTARKPLASRLRIERRATVRYPCHLNSSCRPLAAADHAGWIGEVINLSAGGLALLVSQSFKPRDLLVVELRTRQQDSPRSLLARVVHVRKKEDGKYLLGCAFASLLREHELDALLEDAHP